MINENINQNIQENSDTPETNEQLDSKNQINDNFKYRLERAKDQGIKQILSELGVTSTDEIKALYKKLEETTKKLSANENRG